MTTKPLISTISPSYKMEKYLEKFLQELPKQTLFSKLEFILDHNEPTKKELELVNKFQVKYPGKIKHLVKKKVVPIGESMNDCIKHAQGKYLAIWNLDDLRTPTSLQSQFEELEKNRKDIVYGNYLNVDTFGAKSGNVVDVGVVAKEEYLRGMYLGPFFMFRKSLLKKSGLFDEQLKSGADFDLAIRLALHGKVSKINDNLGYYLNASTGASTRPNSLQPIERTVIELRYGIYDKIENKYLPQASQYSIPYLMISGSLQHLSNFIPDYTQFIQSRQVLVEQKSGNQTDVNLLTKLKNLFH